MPDLASGHGPSQYLAEVGAPGCQEPVIETGWWDELPEDAKKEAFTIFARRALVRRNGHPEDVAQAIIALIENGFITGVVLPCDGRLRLT